MPKVSEIFSSRHLKSEHFNSKPRILVIESYEQEESYGEKKFVLYFANERRGLRLNGTNASDIAKICGDDMAGWPGNAIEIYPATMEITDKETKEKKTIDILRARAAPTPAAPKARTIVAPAKSSVLDDDIPF